MATTRKTIRREYAAANVLCNLAITSATANTQVYNALLSAYVPNRTLTPLVIKPIITITSSDNSIPSGVNASSCTGHKWYIDSTEFSASSLLSASDYSIASDGTLTFKKNFPPGSSHVLYYTSIYPDTRLNVNINIRSEEISLISTESAPESATLYSTTIGGNIIYDPLFDKRAYADYVNAHGGTATYVDDGKTYKNAVTFQLKSADSIIPISKYKIMLYRIDLKGNETLLFDFILRKSDDSYEIYNNTFSSNSYTYNFDYRLIKSDMYVARAYEKSTYSTNGRLLSEYRFNIRRKSRRIRPSIVGWKNLLLSDINYRESVMVHAGGRFVEYPERLYNINWFTNVNVSGYTDLQHNQGARLNVPLRKTGFEQQTGSNTEKQMEVYAEVTDKTEYNVATNEEENTILTDETGNILIFN